MPAIVLILGLATAAAPPERAAAAEAIATGAPESILAEATLTDAGKRGLWAIAGALEHHRSPEARARLFRAAGAFVADHPPGALWLLRRGLREESPEARIGAVAGLERSVGPRAARVLLRHLADPDPEVRRRVAEALAGHDEAVLDAVRARQDDADPRVRETALRTLVRRLQGDAQRSLLARSLLDPVGEVRRAAIELAALTRDPAHAEALRTLAHRGAPEEAVLAARAVAHLPGSRSALSQLLGDPEAPQAAAEVAFAELREARAHALDLLLPPLLGLGASRRDALAAPLVAAPREEEIRDLVGLLDHPAPSRARFARAILTAIGAPADEIAARALLEARPRRAEAIRGHLASRPSGGVTSGLLARARSGSLVERTRSIAAIGTLGTPVVRQKLVALLDDPQAEVRAAAARAVADLEAAETSLLVLAVDPVAEVRAAAVTALGRQLGHLPWKARLAALRDEAPPVRLAAIRGLEGTANPEAIARLENRVLFGTPEERVAAVTAIARSPSTDAAIKLVELVAHRDPAVRRAALTYVDTL